MDILTEEEVKHVAHLARIDVAEEDIKTYQKQLSSLWKEVEKIKEVAWEDETLLVTPVTHNAPLRKDETIDSITFEDVRKNAPRTSGNYIEVPVMVHE